MDTEKDASENDSFAALRLPFVRRFAVGRGAAVLGGQILTLAVGWQLYERTHDPWALGLVGLCQLIPVLLFMLIAGNLADRFPRRNVAMFAHSLQGSAALGLLLLSVLKFDVRYVYAMLMLVGTARAFAAPSVTTIMPQLLKPEHFANANAWLSSSSELAAISGPALGGLLISLRNDPTLAFLAAALLQLVFIVVLSTLPALAPPKRSEKKTPADLFAGFRFIKNQKVFLAAITLDLFAVLLGGATALLPMFAKDILHVGPVGLGWLRAAPSIGALTMALLTTRLPPWKKPGRALLLTVAGFGFATIGFGLSRNFILSLVCLFLVGVFDEISVVIRLTLEQLLTPDKLRGRVSALHYVFISFSNELGGFESGATAALFGPVLSVVSGGIGTVAVVALVAISWPALARLPALSSLRAAHQEDSNDP